MVFVRQGDLAWFGCYKEVGRLEVGVPDGEDADGPATSVTWVTKHLRYVTLESTGVFRALPVAVTFLKIEDKGHIDARCRHNPGWQPLGYLGSPLLCLQSGETIDPEKRRKYIRKVNLMTGSISALVRKKPLSGSSAVTEIWPLVAVFWDIPSTASIKVLVKEQ